MNLAQNLTAALKERRWTLRKLSKESGVPLATLHGWTTGKSAMNLDQLRAVSMALRISLHELAFGSPDPNQPFPPETLTEIFRGDVRLIVQRIDRKPKE